MVPFASDCSSATREGCLIPSRFASCAVDMPSASRRALIQPRTGGVQRFAGPSSLKRSSSCERDCAASLAFFIGHTLLLNVFAIELSLSLISLSIAYGLL